MRDFAKRLIAHETKGTQVSEITKPSGFIACGKLQAHLENIMGSAGFHALLSRALLLAGEDVPWLRSVNVKADGSLEISWEHELKAKVDPKEIAEGGIVLLATLLGLLVSFIGEALTLRLVREVWAKVPLGGLNLGKGDKNENEK